MNSMGPVIFFRTTDTIDTTDTAIWEPGLKVSFDELITARVPSFVTSQSPYG